MVLKVVFFKYDLMNLLYEHLNQISNSSPQYGTGIPKNG